MLVFTSFLCALVAQLAEHIHGKDKVNGSIPFEGLTINSARGRECLAPREGSEYGIEKADSRNHRARVHRVQASKLYYEEE